MSTRSSLMRRFFMMGLLGLICLPARPVLAQEVPEPITIPPGVDCWRTECGRTKLSFCGLKF